MSGWVYVVSAAAFTASLSKLLLLLLLLLLCDQGSELRHQLGLPALAPFQPRHQPGADIVGLSAIPPSAPVSVISRDRLIGKNE